MFVSINTCTPTSLKLFFWRLDWAFSQSTGTRRSSNIFVLFCKKQSKNYITGSSAELLSLPHNLYGILNGASEHIHMTCLLLWKSKSGIILYRRQSKLWEDIQEKCYPCPSQSLLRNHPIILCTLFHKRLFFILWYTVVVNRWGIHHSI